jgi:hypothetical protein
MDRRFLLIALACSPGARLFAQDAARPRMKISADTLRRAVEQRFPLDAGIPGVLQLRVSAPVLALVPASQQVAATFALELAGTQVAAQAGEVDVAFRLRYDAADRSVRAHGIELLDVRWPGLDADTLNLIRDMLPQLVRDTIGEIVLYRFGERDLALPATMGFQPDELVVVGDGVLVTFAPRSSR